MKMGSDDHSRKAKFIHQKKPKLIAISKSSGLPLPIYSTAGRSDLQYLMILLTVISICKTSSCVYDNQPLKCDNSTVGSSSCEAYLVYPIYATEEPAQVAMNLFGDQLTGGHIYVNETQHFLFIDVNCSCTEKHIYLAYTHLRAFENSSNLDSIRQQYRGLAWLPDENYQDQNAIVSRIPLLCMCGAGLTDNWKYMSYVADLYAETDELVKEFDSNLSAFLTANNLAEGDTLFTDAVYYIPVADVKGVPLSKSPALPEKESKDQNNRGASKFTTVFGIAAGALSLVIVITVCVICRNRVLSCFRGKLPHYRRNSWIYLLGCAGSKRCVTLSKNGRVSSVNSNSNLHAWISQEMNNVLEPEKVICFKYAEIVAGTLNFGEKNFLADSWYGSSYSAFLREQYFDIKRTKGGRLTPEFFKELRNLCKLHHANLAGLIGYASNEDELVLIYEFSENGALSDRLHDPDAKGFTPLTWNSRLQISLDVARGLEYLHDHTQIHYVHCDINTSTILLDSDYEAKVGEFGLSRLLQIVGSSGVREDVEYMAPEFIKEGRATAKNDVYAFGILLFELITGKRVTRERGVINQLETCTVSDPVSLSALKECQRPLQMSVLSHWVDPNLFSAYPEDLVCRMFMLTQECLQEDPCARPNMREIVCSLSYILLESIEWDAALAGRSQIFSGLTQGR